MPKNFFANYSQQEISIRQFRAKTPVFYRSLRFMSAVFTGNLKVISALIKNQCQGQHNSTQLMPLRFSPGLGVVGIHCFEYLDTDIGPYNEVSLSFGVQVGTRKIPSWLSLAKSSLTNQYHAVIEQLPVTTEIALYGGVDYFGYPKYLADIEFFEDHERTCILKDINTKETIVEIKGQKLKTKQKPFTMLMNTYPHKDGKILHAKFLLNIANSATSLLHGACNIIPGNHKKSEPFKQLQLGTQLQYMYVENAKGILFMPETT